MKVKLLLFSVFFNFYFLATMGQSFEWAKRAGWYSFDLGYAVASDDAGNVYISGKYEGNASFGNTRVSCAGNHDIYLAKYGPDGSFKWVRTAGGESGDYTHAMDCDGAGNVYITGEIERTVHFGSVTLTGNGSNDVFVAKYNTNGDLIWARKLGGSNKSDKGLGLTLSAGSIYVTGYFQGTGKFGGSASLTSSGGRDIFIAKYTTDGTFLWVKKAGGSGDDEGTAISGDSGGNIYVTGYFTNTANFGGPSVASAGGSDIFIARYNTSGTCVWVKRAGNKGMDYGYGIAADNSGRVFLTGGFRYTTLFGPVSLKAPGGHADMFVACYNSSGDAIWAKRGGGNYNDYGRAIAADAASNVYITGNYGFTATFGSATLNGADSTEIYFASYDAYGNFRWALRASGVQDESDPLRFIEMGLSICVDRSGNVFASGAYRSASTFGGTTLAGWDHTDIYVTKIRQTSGNTIANKTVTVEPKGSASYCSGGTVLLSTPMDSAYQYYFWKKDNKIIEGAEGASYLANSPGSYSVMIVNGTDTISSLPTVVNESKSIIASITPPGSIEGKDSAILLTANPGYGYIYQWKLDGEPIQGATSQTYTAKKPGDYQVKIIQGSCIDWSAVTKVTLGFPKTDNEPSNTKMTDDNSLKAEDSLVVKVYPNPTNGLFTLEINMAPAIAAEVVKIEMLNAVGQVVYHKLVANSNGYINEHLELESTIPTGIYFLQVTIGNKTETTRMMLTK